MRNSFKRLMLIMGVILFTLPAYASLNDSIQGSPVRESIFNDKYTPLWKSHFTWGAEFGASIDLSGYDTSTFDVDVVLGYKNKWLKLVGIGGGIHRAFGTGDNFIPVYAIIRTSFTSRPSLFFLSFKAGYSFNTMGDAPTFGDTSAQIGAGLNLAVSKRFQSHIVLSYGFRHFNKRHTALYELPTENIALASLSFGVNF